MENNTTEREILDRLAANDPSALEMIWNLYSHDLLGYLMGIFCFRPEAEDTLQDVFIGIARKPSLVAKAKQLKPYLFRLARNTAFNRLAKNKRQRKGAEAMSSWLEVDTDREEQLQPGETEQLESALAELPEGQRSVIVLKFFRHMTFQEISQMLEISQNTAASRYRYGMEKLKTLLKETFS